LSGGSETDEEFASRGKKFFGHEHGERSADHPADNPDLAAAEHKGVEFGVIARPTFKGPGGARPTKPANQIAVGIEEANGRNASLKNPFLPSRFSQQSGRLEYGGQFDPLIAEEDRRIHLSRSSSCRREKRHDAARTPSGSLGPSLHG
jgi:hypothetical protein